MQWFSDLPIGRKLALGFGTLTAMLLLVGGTGVAVSRTIDARMRETFTQHADPALRLKEANVRLLAISRAVRNAILDETPDAVRGRQQEIVAGDSAFRADFDAYRAFIKRPEQRQMAAELLRQYDALRPRQDAIVQLALDGNDAEARRRLPEIRRVADSIDVAMDALAASKSELMQAAVADATRASTLGLAAIVTLALLALGVAIGAGLVVTRSIVEGLSALGAVATAATRGEVDVTVRLDRRDEVGRLAVQLRELMDAQRVMAAAATALSRGDTSARVTPRSPADVLGHAFVALRDTTEALVADATRLAEAAGRGDLAARADAARFDGAFARLVTTVNALVDAVAAPVGETATVLGRLADRDLAARMAGTYQGDFARIADAVNRAGDALDAAMQDVRDAAGQVASAGQQIAAGSQSLAQGASTQSASLEEIGSSVEELTAMSVQAAANLAQARDMTQGMHDRVGDGRRSMDALTTAIGEIQRTSDETARIARTIEEIAFQTNLLALNAAVEAARAGDAGRGFSVVAEEVRALATRSAEAAKHSTQLIESAITQARRGVSLKDEVVGRLVAIEHDVERVSGLVGEVAEAGEQQRSGITQINQAVGQLNGITQQAAANAEESSAAAQQLAAQAMTLNELVSRFQLTDGFAGGRTGRGAAAEPWRHDAGHRTSRRFALAGD